MTHFCSCRQPKKINIKHCPIKVVILDILGSLFSVIFHFLPVLADRTKYWRTDLITIILKQKLVHSIYKCRFLFHRHVLSRGSFTFMSVSLEMLCLPPMNSLVRPFIVIIKIINSNIIITRPGESIRRNIRVELEQTLAIFNSFSWTKG